MNPIDLMKANPQLVTVVITCAIKPGKMDMAKRELEEIGKIVIDKESACHGIRVHIESKETQRLLIIECWDNIDVFTGPHMQTSHMQQFLKTAETFLDGEAEFSFWHEIIVAP